MEYFNYLIFIFNCQRLDFHLQSATGFKLLQTLCKNSNVIMGNMKNLKIWNERSDVHSLFSHWVDKLKNYEFNITVFFSGICDCFLDS